MKKLTVFAFLVTLILGAATLSATEFTFEPETLKGKAGEEKTVTVLIKWTHRKCELPVGDITVDVENATEVKRGEWEKVKKGYFKMSLTIKLGKKGKAKVRAWHECTKVGISEGSLEIDVE